jgi:hypothetical protein
VINSYRAEGQVYMASAEDTEYLRLIRKKVLITMLKYYQELQMHETYKMQSKVIKLKLVLKNESG